MAVAIAEENCPAAGAALLKTRVFRRSHVNSNPLYYIDPLGLEKKPSCFSIFCQCMLEQMFGPGIGEAIDKGLSGASASYQTKAVAYATEKGLTVPLRSSVVRRFLRLGKVAGRYSGVGTLAFVIIDETICLKEEIDALEEGKCE